MYARGTSLELFCSLDYKYLEDGVFDICTCTWLGRGIVGNAGLICDCPWCRNAYAGLTLLTDGRNADARTDFFRQTGIYLLFLNIL
jgi:hypothetical protein